MLLGKLVPSKVHAPSMVLLHRVVGEHFGEPALWDTAMMGSSHPKVSAWCRMKPAPARMFISGSATSALVAGRLMPTFLSPMPVAWSIMPIMPPAPAELTPWFTPRLSMMMSARIHRAGMPLRSEARRMKSLYLLQTCWMTAPSPW